MATRWRFEVQRIESIDVQRLIYCRECRCGRQAKLMRTRRWLKFGGYRFFPLWGTHRFLVCEACGQQYDLEILRINPGRTAPPIDLLMLRVMIHAALADGLVDTKERQVISDLYAAKFDMVLLQDQLKQEIEKAQRESSSLNTYVASGAELMTEGQKRLVIELAYLTMAAGGPPKPGQQRQLHNLSNSLQLPPEYVPSVVDELRAV